MTRLEALKAAREYVAGLAEEKNARGYQTYNLSSPAERIALEIRVAKFLLGVTEDEE